MPCEYVHPSIRLVQRKVCSLDLPWQCQIHSLDLVKGKFACWAPSLPITLAQHQMSSFIHSLDCSTRSLYIRLAQRQVRSSDPSTQSSFIRFDQHQVHKPKPADERKKCCRNTLTKATKFIQNHREGYIVPLTPWPWSHCM